MKFKIGDVVFAIDELIEGKVVGFKDNQVVVETKDGFELDFNENELIASSETISQEIEMSVPHPEVFKEKESSKKHKSPLLKKEKHIPVLEVDLHINQLVKSTRGMDNYDMLNLQIETAQRQLDFAIQKRFQRLVFIHGVGEGVLRQELEFLLKRYDNIKFYDADYQKYGRGATEVYIFQNPAAQSSNY
ncbi:Smr/MutS family protein [uncultured Planktosalinus sp.]|uniref:Smr/MutS family protein n=1 Tax=uncultured Planktosalinus sp. TaxID=1810935 RepID=UPI0030D97E68